MTATTILSNAIPVGNLIASIIPGLVFGDDNGISQDELKKKFVLYLIIISGIATGLALPLIFLARDLPPTPPSVIASKKEEQFEFRKECK